MNSFPPGSDARTASTAPVLPLFIIFPDMFFMLPLIECIDIVLDSGIKGAPELRVIGVVQNQVYLNVRTVLVQPLPYHRCRNQIGFCLGVTVRTR